MNAVDPTVNRPSARRRLEVSEVRRQNVLQLVEELCNGNMAQFARLIKRGHTYVHQICTGIRPIGEQIARYIEDALSLPPESLDVKPPRPLKARRQFYVTYSPDLGRPMHIFAACPEITWDELRALAQSNAKDWHKALLGPSRQYRWCQVTCSDQAFHLRAKDNAMSPEINQGDFICGDHKRVKPEHDGVFFLYSKDWPEPAIYKCHQSGGEVRFFRVNRELGGCIAYDPERVKIVAQVVQATRILIADDRPATVAQLNTE